MIDLVKIWALRGCAFLFLGGLWGGIEVAGQSQESARLFYSIERQATVYKDADSTNAFFKLKFREPVGVLEHQGRWSLIESEDGSVGYVASSAISNVWIRISKRKKSVCVQKSNYYHEQCSG